MVNLGVVAQYQFDMKKKINTVDTDKSQKYS